MKFFDRPKGKQGVVTLNSLKKVSELEEGKWWMPTNDSRLAFPAKYVPLFFVENGAVKNLKDPRLAFMRKSSSQWKKQSEGGFILVLASCYQDARWEYDSHPEEWQFINWDGTVINKDIRLS